MSPSLLLRTSTFALLHYYTMFFFLNPNLANKSLNGLTEHTSTSTSTEVGASPPRSAANPVRCQHYSFHYYLLLLLLSDTMVHPNPLFRDKEKGAILHSHACSRTNTAINVTALPVLLLLDKGKHRWKPVRKYNRRTHLLCLITSEWRGQ